MTCTCDTKLVDSPKAFERWRVRLLTDKRIDRERLEAAIYECMQKIGEYEQQISELTGESRKFWVSDEYKGIK